MGPYLQLSCSAKYATPCTGQGFHEQGKKFISGPSSPWHAGTVQANQPSRLLEQATKLQGASEGHFRINMGCSSPPRFSTLFSLPLINRGVAKPVLTCTMIRPCAGSTCAGPNWAPNNAASNAASARAAASKSPAAIAAARAASAVAAPSGSPPT